MSLEGAPSALTQQNNILIYSAEGVPSLVAVPVAYFLLPNGQFECPFLNERDNQIIGARAFKGRGGDTEKKINFKQVFAAFYDCKNYMQAVIIFCLNVRGAHFVADVFRTHADTFLRLPLAPCQPTFRQ